MSMKHDHQTGWRGGEGGGRGRNLEKIFFFAGNIFNALFIITKMLAVPMSAILAELKSKHIYVLFFAIISKSISSFEKFYANIFEDREILHIIIPLSINSRVTIVRVVQKLGNFQKLEPLHKSPYLWVMGIGTPYRKF